MLKWVLLIIRDNLCPDNQWKKGHFENMKNTVAYLCFVE